MFLRRFTILMMSIVFFQTTLMFSQEEEKEAPKYGWTKTAVGNINFTQSSFDNWSQGGENSWAWLLGVNTKAVNDQERTNWATTAKLEYGQSKIGDTESKKSADEIFLESVLGYKLKPHFSIYGAVSGRSQFASGYEFKDSTTADGGTIETRKEISRFLNPGYFMEGVGFQYNKGETFNTRLGVAAKQTIVTEEQFAPRYSDKIDTESLEKIRNEIGLESVSKFNKKIYGNIVYATSLELFSNFKSVEEIDARWDNLFSAEVAKYIAVSFNFQIFYDYDISRQRQLKQILAVGLTYNLL